MSTWPEFTAVMSVALVGASYVLAGLLNRSTARGWHLACLALVPAAVALVSGWPLTGWTWIAPVLVGGAACAGYWLYHRVEVAGWWLLAQAGTVLAIMLSAMIPSTMVNTPMTPITSAVRVPVSVVAVAVLLAGFVAALLWGGEFVARATRRFTSALHAAPEPLDGLVRPRGLPKGFAEGGKTIGQWERLLIMLFVLASAPTAIGFLVTAKSILRFGEIKDPNTQKEAEYIIIGTMMSFGFALVVAYATREVLQVLMPQGLWACIAQDVPSLTSPP